MFRLVTVGMLPTVAGYFLSIYAGAQMITDGNDVAGVLLLLCGVSLSFLWLTMYTFVRMNRWR